MQDNVTQNPFLANVLFFFCFHFFLNKLKQFCFVSGYSLTKEGHCPEDEEIGFNNCTWRDDRRVVTIELQCLLDLGFVQACEFAILIFFF